MMIQVRTKRDLDQKDSYGFFFFDMYLPTFFLFISGSFEVENTMQLLKKVGRSIFFDVNPISQPVTGCAQSSKTFCCISLLEIDLSVPYQPLYPTPPLYVRYS